MRCGWRRTTHLNVDLWAVERAVSGLDLPRSSKRVERTRKGRLGHLPRLEFAERLLGSRREVELKREPQLVVAEEKERYG